MFRDTNDLKRILWIVITGMVIATIIANLRVPIFPGWQIPLERSDITPDQLYGAKAATLAVLGAVSLFLALVSNPLSKPALRVDFFIGVTTAVSALAAGWFWLLGETGGNPVPFLIALVPSLAYMGMLLAIVELFRVAIRMDSRAIRERVAARPEPKFILATVGLLAVITGVVYLLIWLPLRIF